MKTKIAIMIEFEVLGTIDEMAEEIEELDLTGSQSIQDLLSIGLADAQALKVAGLIDLAGW